MKKVLIITYYFPPRPAIASVRLGGLAKYLPEFGWEPVILTASLPGTPDKQFQVVQTFYLGDVTARLKKKIYLHPDKSFQEQIRVPLAVREGKHSITSKISALVKSVIAYPDDQKGWYPFAVKMGEELLQKGDFDAIISSSSPATVHLIAKHLKRKHHHLPWIADLRDLWTQNHYYLYGSLRKWFEKRLELQTLAWADALVTVSKPLADMLNTLHHGKPVFAIPNGFDPDELGSAPLTREFTITYTGELYQGRRDPVLLLKVLHGLIAEGLIDPTTIKIRFFGPSQYWLEQEIRRYYLEGIVKQYGMVSREIALARQRESQILLLLNWDDPREQGVYTGKVFEYLAAQRPILAIGGPGGVVKELLEETNAGIHTSRLEDLQKILLEYYREYKSTGKVGYQGDKNKIQKYNHREMAKKFVQVLEEVKK
jgi:glycosyltransferase involved in cell wall biosynthesis